jgi:hypothetical protein
VADGDDFDWEFPARILDDQRAKVVMDLGYEVMGRCPIPSFGSDGKMCDVLEGWDVHIPRTINETMQREHSRLFRKRNHA